jgi:hypothetical protein
MYLSNLYFVLTRDHVLPFYVVGEDAMIHHGTPKWDWLSSQKDFVVDRDATPANQDEYKDLVINVTEEGLK